MPFPIKQKFKCAMGDSPPDLKVTYTCVAGGCEDEDVVISWRPGGSLWAPPDGVAGPTMWWSDEQGAYVIMDTTASPPVNFNLAGVCSPFRFTASNVGPFSNGCSYDVTVEVNQP